MRAAPPSLQRLFCGFTVAFLVDADYCWGVIHSLADILIHNFKPAPAMGRAFLWNEGVPTATEKPHQWPALAQPRT
jgi:hypothetical protein